MTVDWNLEIAAMIGITIGYGVTIGVIYLFTKDRPRTGDKPRREPNANFVQWTKSQPGVYIICMYSVCSLGASVAQDLSLVLFDFHSNSGFAWRYFFPFLFSLTVFWRSRLIGSNSVGQDNLES